MVKEFFPVRLECTTLMDPTMLRAKVNTSSGSAWMTEGSAVLIFRIVPFTTAGREKRLNCVIVLVITCTVTAS